MLVVGLFAPPSSAQAPPDLDRPKTKAEHDAAVKAQARYEAELAAREDDTDPEVETEIDLEELIDPEGPVLLLQTLRSHDQYNTTIYGLDDRYRGVHGGRLVVFVKEADIARLGLADGQFVDLVSHFHDVERRVRGFRIVAYPTPVGCVAAYYPETNPLIALGHRSIEAGTPASKSVPVTLEPTAFD